MGKIFRPGLLKKKKNGYVRKNEGDLTMSKVLNWFRGPVLEWKPSTNPNMGTGSSSMAALANPPPFFGGGVRPADWDKLRVKNPSSFW